VSPPPAAADTPPKSTSATPAKGHTAAAGTRFAATAAGSTPPADATTFATGTDAIVCTGLGTNTPSAARADDPNNNDIHKQHTNKKTNERVNHNPRLNQKTTTNLQ
jgi:hypothetical protein